MSPESQRAPANTMQQTVATAQVKFTCDHALQVGCANET
eukprot:CAMPEP_0175837306 /NCGR_PEP_ID=MMETSP0107_2-20121207/17621_1 /TAXON_ID=195067 ORGANISM="Goniomonas pacifica, Strain CCMP1869" /NCGR_SAMPLE_ID=MMETSP0107_2 /ASSEMBLY_ACC=CAM_ASM_000203 /LENGTH=38 /DNA_ID= /DNA_START= /DNA_END= /DNA_ORIENTATION=